MKLQTHIPLKPQENNLIDYNSKLLLLGSCFVENIGEKLGYFKFQNTVNPFGILFNPIAIEHIVINALNNKEYSEDDVFFNNEQWHCFDAHSNLSNSSKDLLLKNLNANIKLANQQITESTHIIITLGTAWVYRHVEKNTIVANCHKVAQKQFEKELLSVEEITTTLNSIREKIYKANPNATIIFTVSPVRHIKDGFIENTQSKAHLITAIHQVVKSSNALHYFPSYEIMIDELRDYRFYKEDMIHPNTTAINYIWQKFQHVWISSIAEITMDEVNTIQKGLRHKPFNASSKKHLDFLKTLALQKEKVIKQFPIIKF